MAFESDESIASYVKRASDLQGKPRMVQSIASIGASMLTALARLKICELPDEAPVYNGRSKLEVLMGAGIWEELSGRTVLDFGCGPGVEAVEIAEHGAAHVVGLDIRDEWLDLARARAAAVGVSSRCTFARDWFHPVDTIVCVDSFEHFEDPVGVLGTMYRLVRTGGQVIASFGPPWKHPLGGHVYSIFPYSHLVFPDEALVRWRQTFKSDGAQTVLQSGLNKMTVGRFERIVSDSPFRFDQLEVVPIRPLRRFANRLTREFTTSIVRCRLVSREA